MIIVCEVIFTLRPRRDLTVLFKGFAMEHGAKHYFFAPSAPFEHTFEGVLVWNTMRTFFFAPSARFEGVCYGIQCKTHFFARLRRDFEHLKANE